MIFRPALVPLTLTLGLLLAACGTTEVQALPAAVSGPSSGKLKIGTPVSFTALGTSGAVLDPSTLTWSSSNPAVASVNAAGTVTAHRLGTVTITATAGGQTQTSALQTTYGLEFAVGTLNRSILGLPNDFVHFAKLRLPDGSAPAAGSGIDITGPGNWNGGTPDTGLPINTGTQKYRIVYNTNPATPGAYNATTTMGGETYTASASLNPAGLLPPASNVTVTSIAPGSVTATWTAAAGAASYRTYISDCGTAPNPTPATATCTTVVIGTGTTAPTATLSGFTLVAGRTYAFNVWALNVDITQADPETPSQINVSLNGRYFRLPTP